MRNNRISIATALIAFFYVIIFTTFINCKNQLVERTGINKEWNGMVMTVHGLMPADSMGVTLPHEHLLIKGFRSEWDLNDEETAISELTYFANAGGRSLTELTTIGIGRNPEGLSRISKATGINVIMGTGFYKEWWLSDTIKNKSVQELTDIMVSEILVGINGIHAGVIGEIGIQKHNKRFGIPRNTSRFEKKLLKASAHAQQITGASIVLHADIDADAKARNHMIDILEKNGADLNRVSISHNTPYLNQVDDFVSYAERGCYVAFDNLGLEVSKTHKDAFYSQGELQTVEIVKILIDKGYLKKILISQDTYEQEQYVKNGGYGYAYVLKEIVPQLIVGGVTEEQIYTILVENPKTLYSF